MNLKVKEQYERNDILKDIRFYHKYIKDTVIIEDCNHETLIVLLKGELEFTIDDKVFNTKRNSVFNEKASSIYIPFNKSLKITPNGEAEIAICKTASTKQGEIVFIKPDEVKEVVRGKDGFKRRVYDILDQYSLSDRLVVGETVNCTGQWSSYPPHKHDENKKDEVKMEELYLFKLNPENGFGFQRIYTEDGSVDETMTINNNDITLIPKGYHPVSVMPGYEIYYLWILVGENKILMPYTQDKYRWLLDE